MIKANTVSVRKKYAQEDMFRILVWDYNMTPQEFFLILDNNKAEGSLNRDWAISRVLENLNYYDAVSLVNPALIKQRWTSVRNKIHNSSIKRGYDYILQRSTLPTAR